MSLAQLFYAKQAFRRAMQWARQWSRQRRHAHAPRSFQLEPLEPRLLMSADPTMLAPASLTRVSDGQSAVVEGANFPPGAFNAASGSRLREGFGASGEVDAFYFDATAGYHLALELIPQVSEIRGRVEILDPTGVSIGSVDAGSAGGYVLLQDKVLSQTGRYTIEFESLNGTGAYDANVFVGTTSLPAVPAATNNWINAAGGNWSTASNWSLGVAPTATDIVGITLDGTYTVTLDVTSTVSGLVLGGTTGTQSFTINGQILTLNGLSHVGTRGVVNLTSGTLQGSGELDIDGRLNWNGGTLSGTGLTVIGSSGTVAIAGSSHTLNRTVENQGTVTWSASPVTQGGSSFLNKGIFVSTTASTLDWNGGVTGGTNAFINQGIFQNKAPGRLVSRRATRP